MLRRGCGCEAVAIPALGTGKRIEGRGERQWIRRSTGDLDRARRCLERRRVSASPRPVPQEQVVYVEGVESADEKESASANGGSEKSNGSSEETKNAADEQGAPEGDAPPVSAKVQ